MLENIASFAFASLLVLGNYTLGTYETEIISPIPPSVEKTAPPSTPTPTMIPTATPTPLPTAAPTPTPTLPPPTPTPTPILTSEELENIFSKYSSEYNVDKEQLKKIAHCESGFNSEARFLDYGGIFQFSSESWRVTREHMGHDQNPDLRFNAEESVKTAAFKISRGGISAWPNCH